MTRVVPLKDRVIPSTCNPYAVEGYLAALRTRLYWGQAPAMTDVQWHRAALYVARYVAELTRKEIELREAHGPNSAWREHTDADWEATARSALRRANVLRSWLKRIRALLDRDPVDVAAIRSEAFALDAEAASDFRSRPVFTGDPAGEEQFWRHTASQAMGDAHSYSETLAVVRAYLAARTDGEVDLADLRTVATITLDPIPMDQVVDPQLLEQLDELQERAWANKVAKGFNVTDVQQEFLLLHDEVAEAWDAVYCEAGLSGELADIAIYTLALARMTGADLPAAVRNHVCTVDPTVGPDGQFRLLNRAIAAAHTAWQDRNLGLLGNAFAQVLVAVHTIALIRGITLGVAVLHKMDINEARTYTRLPSGRFVKTEPQAEPAPAWVEGAPIEPQPGDVWCDTALKGVDPRGVIWHARDDGHGGVELYEPNGPGLVLAADVAKIRGGFELISREDRA